MLLSEQIICLGLSHPWDCQARLGAFPPHMLRKCNSFLECSFWEEIPSCCCPSGACTRLSHPRCCCHEDTFQFSHSVPPSNFTSVFPTCWYPYPASFFQLLTELLALNLEQSCCFLQNHSWRNHNPGQVHFCPRAHPDNFISPHIFTKAGQQEFHLGLCSPASFPPHPKSHQQRDGLTEPQHRGIPGCHSSGMEGQG